MSAPRAVHEAGDGHHAEVVAVPMRHLPRPDAAGPVGPDRLVRQVDRDRRGRGRRRVHFVDRQGGGHRPRAPRPCHRHRQRGLHGHQHFRLTGGYVTGAGGDERHAVDQRVKMTHRRLRAQVVRREDGAEPVVVASGRRPAEEVQPLLEHVDSRTGPADHRVDMAHLGRNRDAQVCQALRALVVRGLEPVGGREPVELCRQSIDHVGLDLGQAGEREVC